MTERAGIYGGSLYDLAKEENLSDSIMEQLEDVKQLFRENPDYIRLLSEPAIKREERIKLIDDAFKDSEQYLRNFLKLLCEKGLLGEFEGCVSAYKKRYYADNNIAEALVTSAVKLSPQQLSALSDQIAKKCGKKVILSDKLDPG
ncbi:MAG: ATP synthase F1 subunit delta, partial [Lachnospiraceae bacterium]|nr:ATP synthase F1 subunit delta [Lachnospiraceae bacterium]